MGRLVRAHVGARTYQGLFFWLAFAHNVNGIIAGTGYGGGRVRMWITLGAIVFAATVGSYYQWRFGRVEAPRPSERERWYEVTLWGLIGAATLIVGLVVMMAAVGIARRLGVKPIDSAWVIVSAATAMSLARSRGDRYGWLVPLLATSTLLATSFIPALQPYRAVGHAAMAAALIVTAVQLHRFLLREFNGAQV